MLSRGDGGLEKHVAELSNILSNSCRVTVVADERYRKQFCDKVNFVAVDARRGRMSILFARQVANILNQTQSDVVHAHAGKAASLMLLVKLFYRDSQFVVTRHNTTNPSRFYLKRFDACIAVSETVAQSEQSIDWKVVHNGTQLPQVSDAPISLQQPAIITVARLVKIKGLDFILDAWTNPDAHLYIIGDGPERESLEKQARDAGLKNIHFVGFTDRVADYLSQAKLMLITSFREGGPYTMVEALLAEVPVIATDVGNTKALLPKHAIINKGNAQDIAGAIDRVLNEPEELKASFSDSFEYARGNLTVEKMVENTISVYQSVLAKLPE